MIISENWLREMADPQVSGDELAAKLTMLGLEVESIGKAALDFSRVIVAQVVSVEPHPQADRLQVCQVDTGTDSVQIVCGAPNVKVGIKVPLAQVGAVLPGDFKIGKAKLRQVESFGMLCSKSELGISEDSDSGLWLLAPDAPLGANLRQYLELDDRLIELDLTPNRADCLSVLGIARELATAYGLPKIELAKWQLAEDSSIDVPKIELESPAACPKYCARVIKNVDLSKPTPMWMVERLRKSGIRSLNLAVDVTNYVMLEIGQPMHAFDLSKINGNIKVRLAKEGETITLLDGSKQQLDDKTLLIADDEQPLAMAGIMGGESSAVSADSKDILLESAFFTPSQIIGRARQYGLHTDSSHRFERGVDWNLQQTALDRASFLIMEVAGGAASPISCKIDQQSLAQNDTIKLRHARIERVLGFELSFDAVSNYLNALNMQFKTQQDSWQVVAPSYRFDINIEADLIEEIVRLVGYQNIKYSNYQGSVEHKISKGNSLDLDYYKSILVGRGYQEAICYSFISKNLQHDFAPKQQPKILSNPISQDLSTMRTSLVPGLLLAVKRNLNRQQKNIKLFESGLRFLPTADKLIQEEMLAGVISNEAFATCWSEDARMVDFYDIKGDVQALLSKIGWHNLRFVAGSDSAYHPGKSADIYCREKLIGKLGALHPTLLKKMKINAPTYAFELACAALKSYTLPLAQPISDFPSTRRDIALLVAKDISSEQIINTIKQAAGSELQSVVVFDVYQGDKLKENLKSVALGLILQDFSSTLSETTIDSIVQGILEAVKNKLNAVLRD